LPVRTKVVVPRASSTKQTTAVVFALEQEASFPIFVRKASTNQSGTLLGEPRPYSDKHPYGCKDLVLANTVAYYA